MSVYVRAGLQDEHVPFIYTETHIQGLSPAKVKQINVSVSCATGTIDVRSTSNQPLGITTPPPDHIPRVAGSRFLGTKHLASYSLIRAFTKPVFQNRLARKAINVSKSLTRRISPHLTPYELPPPAPTIAKDEHGWQTQEVPKSTTMSYFARAYRSLATLITNVDIAAERGLSKLDARVILVKETILEAARSVLKYICLPFRAARKAKRYFARLYAKESSKWRSNGLPATLLAVLFTMLIVGFDGLVIVGDWVFDSRERAKWGD